MRAFDLEVLDDHAGEAAEVAKHNPWLAYGAPLHRLREFGVAGESSGRVAGRPRLDVSAVGAVYSAAGRGARACSAPRAVCQRGIDRES